MTPEQIDLVKSSWARVIPAAGPSAALFYEKLFNLDPEVRGLFKGDMEEQGRKLTTMITTAVNSLDRFDELAPALQQLGRRHVDYGVRDEHYDTVGAALLWTLEQGLGETFTDAVREAWTTVYGQLAATMKTGARAAA